MWKKWMRSGLLMGIFSVLSWGTVAAAERSSPPDLLSAKKEEVTAAVSIFETRSGRTPDINMGQSLCVAACCPCLAPCVVLKCCTEICTLPNTRRVNYEARVKNTLQTWRMLAMQVSAQQNVGTETKIYNTYLGSLRSLQNPNGRALFHTEAEYTSFLIEVDTTQPTEQPNAVYPPPVYSVN